VGRKVGVTFAQVVDAAAAVADEHRGAAASTPTAVAERLGVKTPSLYAHVEGAAGLRRLVARRAHAALYAALVEATSSAGTPVEQLRQLCYAYRGFAHRHPGLYDALLPVPTTDDDPDGAAVALDAVEVISAPLAALHLDPDRRIATIRWMRALLHGFVDLELSGGFGLSESIEESFEYAVDLVVATIAGTERKRR
jgi:AcrR family transcriptional regulator